MRSYVARRQIAAISQVTFFYATPSIISFIGVSLAFYFLLKYLSVLLGIISLTYLLFFIIPADFPSVKITCTLEFLPSLRFYYLKLHDSFVYPLSFTSATFVLRSRFPSTNPEAPSSFRLCIVDRYIDIDFLFDCFGFNGSRLQNGKESSLFVPSFLFFFAVSLRRFADLYRPQLISSSVFSPSFIERK